MKGRSITSLVFLAWFILNFVIYKLALYEKLSAFIFFLIIAPCVISGMYLHALIDEWKGERKERLIVTQIVAVVLLLAIGCAYIVKFSNR